MVDQLNAFAGRGHARGARGRHRRAGSAARPAVPGVAGTWKDLTDSVNSMASNLTAQVRNIARGRDRRSPTATSRSKITVDVRGEILQLKETHQHHGGPAQRASPPR